ncbi:hypothetical protein A4X13_0g5846 [Tilletia indica]|uniref:Uncharacterized protein n=1 Tax=Tilletia indica TaxID=43049 RepID=A0A177TSG2_9BASI|nr:hypothetical protein A4X13_0g5846 [Tilletia indica]
MLNRNPLSAFSNNSFAQVIAGAWRYVISLHKLIRRRHWLDSRASSVLILTTRPSTTSTCTISIQSRPAEFLSHSFIHANHCWHLGYNVSMDDTLSSTISIQVHAQLNSSWDPLAALASAGRNGGSIACGLTSADDWRTRGSLLLAHASHSKASKLDSQAFRLSKSDESMDDHPHVQSAMSAQLKFSGSTARIIAGAWHSAIPLALCAARSAGAAGINIQQGGTMPNRSTLKTSADD